MPVVDARSEQSTASVFVGRETELDALTTVLDAGALTSGFVVLVLGEGGIGKTTLIAEALRRVPAQRVLSGVADAGDLRPHGMLLDAFAPTVTDDDRRVTAEANEHAVGERLLDLLDEATAQPAVLVLEDLQWADAASLRLLTRLARTLDALPLVIVGSMRTQAHHESSPLLSNLIHVLSERGLLRLIELGALGQAECLSIAERLTGGRANDALAHYIAAAGGNPLFLTEMIRALQRDGAVTVDATGEAVVQAPVGPSPSLAMVMMRHLSHLSVPVRELLTSAALLGTRFSANQLRIVADVPMTALVPMLRESVAAGVLEEAGDDQLGFRHQLIQEVLLQDLPAAIRAELQRELALRLEAAGVEATTVAGHLLQSRTSPADLPWMLRVADRTAVRAPAVAAELWEQVAQATEPSEALNTQAIAGLARAALSGGNAAQSSALAESVLQYDVPAGVLPGLATTYTHALLLEQRTEAALAQSQRFAASELLTPVDRATHLAFSAWPQLVLGDIEGAGRMARDAAAVAADVGNPGAEILALTLQGQIADFRGDLSEAIALLSRAVALADGHPSLASIEAFPHVQLALALTDAQREAEVAGLLRRGAELSERFGYWAGAVAGHSHAAQVLSHIGTLPDVAAEVDAHRALVSSADARTRPPMLGLAAWVAAHQRGPAAAAQWSAQLDPVPERAAWAGRGRAWIWLGLSQRERAGGDPVATLAVLWSGWQELRDGEMIMDCADLALEVVELAIDVAETHPSHSGAARERAAEVVELMGRLADRNPSVTHLRATALAVHGVASQTPDALVEAAGLLSGSSRQWDHARIAELAALALPRRDARRRTQADASLHAYREVGADYDLARARAAFQRAGIAGINRPRTRPAFGWESLTRTEERIAGFVTTGASNPEIARDLSVSRRTIESHVSSILAKLGLRSRTELAVFVARRLEDAG